MYSLVQRVTELETFSLRKYRLFGMIGESPASSWLVPGPGPWLHENRMVPSTLNLCLKKITNRIRGYAQYYAVHGIETEEEHGTRLPKSV
jgi:hypothetical protein